MNIITIIPSRLASSRLPNKALADINGAPMIVHVWRRAMEANLGPVIVACGDRQIADAIHREGGETVMTDPTLISGSDRVFAALKAIDPVRKYDVIVNLQGDMPTASCAMLSALVVPLQDPDAEIATLASVITTPTELHSTSVVKASISFKGCGSTGRAMYFSRNVIPWGSGGALSPYRPVCLPARRLGKVFSIATRSA